MALLPTCGAELSELEFRLLCRPSVKASDGKDETRIETRKSSSLLLLLSFSVVLGHPKLSGKLLNAAALQYRPLVCGSTAHLERLPE